MRSLLRLLVFFAGYMISTRNCLACNLDVQFPRIILSGVHFSFDVTFPPFNGSDSIPRHLYVELVEKGVVLYNATCETRSINGTDIELTHTFGPVKHPLKLGHHHLSVIAYDGDYDPDNGDQVCESYEQRILSVPGWLTVFPPIFTAIVAIAFRQVLLALVGGIWLAAFLGHGYNPLTAILRTLDTYIVDAMVDHDHSAIIVATFFLGGLIGLVQRSGGGLGLANFFSKFASSTRRASVVCFIVALLIFFDDYTCVLITGNSLRMVMDKAGVSKDKFAFIVQSMAPSVASFFPISSWVGAQIGYVQSGFDRCPSDYSNVKPFNVVVESMPYRFLPLLMMFCVIFVCLLNRDFGCMLTVEKKQYSSNIQNRLVESRENGGTSGEEDEDDERILESKPLLNSSPRQEVDESLFEGALAPKRGIPHRWFNAVIPFLIVILITFLGMILSGYYSIRSSNKTNPDDKIKYSATNIFGNGDALAALIWGSALATVVLVLMLAVQRILNLKEVMECWVEGVKDVVEPLIILILAWALGNIISEIQTSNFIAQALNGNISARYIPVITAIIGYFMAYCTGSAFGTMGILFPLVIPTVCRLQDTDRNAQIQTSAAILSSCIFGNLMSPIADLTVMTRVATKCDYNSHLKTCALYVLLTGFVSLIFGTLPVGARWYPWYVAWIVMPIITILVFVLVSSGHRIDSRSLLRRMCPCICLPLDRFYFRCASRLNIFKVRYLSKLPGRRSRPRSGKNTEGLVVSGGGIQVGDDPQSMASVVTNHEIKPQVEGEFRTAQDHSSTGTYYSSDAT